MCRKLNWHDTLYGAKHPDPPQPGIRNRHSPQRRVLVRSKHTYLHLSRKLASTRRMAARGVAMAEDEAEGADLERLCQGLSPDNESCTYPATVHCTSCKKWFCDAHAEDERWHPCMLPPGDEGGEA